MKTISANLEELRRLGLFLTPDFFSPEFCYELRLAANTRSAEAASVIVDGVATVDSRVRRAECCDILAHDLNMTVCHHLSSVLPTVAEHYGVSLMNFEAPQIVRYPLGGFYRPHVDSAQAGSCPSAPHRRKISCVVFLNDSARSTDNANFIGGALAFFRPVTDSSNANCKILLYPVSGLLVAFRSNLYHEVLPVMAGERFTLVTWFE